MNATKRMTAKDRKTQILTAAIEIAQKKGFDRISKSTISKALGISPNDAKHHFGSMANLKSAVMKAAVELKITSVIVYGIAIKHPDALAASDELKAEALNETFAY